MLGQMLDICNTVKHASFVWRGEYGGGIVNFLTFLYCAENITIYSE